MELATKRVNVFTYDANEETKRPRYKLLEEALRAFEWCSAHKRYCGPNHERFYIEEEKRWMNSWEEYKYVCTCDYYADVPVTFCAADTFRPCAICGMKIEDHIRINHDSEYWRNNFVCSTKIMRKYYNRFTHYLVGMPQILDLDEMSLGKFTQ
jgi:hypothetical protein